MTVDSLVLSKMDKIKILPPLSLSTLTEAQLCEIIPLLVKLATGRGQAQFELAEVQPRWWPTDIPWMNPATLHQNPHLSGVTWKEMLCKIVRCCYSYSGQESLLLQQDNRTAAHGTSAVGRDKVKCDTSVVNAGSVERYLCSICIRQFESRDALQHHQEISKHTLLQNCHARSNIMPALCLPFREVHTVSDSAQILDTQETHHKDMHHISKAVLPGLRLSKQKCRRHVESHPSEVCTQEEFMLVCGLVTNSNASRLKHEAEETLVDLDCQIIAVEGLPNIAPLASPRSSISLMSQLSRQMTSARKRLDFAKNVEGSDNDNSDSGAGSIVPAAQGSLLGIDFSSPLGQRLKKHMKTDLSLPIVSNMEKYCKTFLEKTEFLHKLRLRPLFDYPVTFKKSKKPMCAYYHTYKFNQEERREFVRTYRTGLNKKSRFLRQQMKKCFVCLKRLSGEEIKVWTLKRRTILNQEIPIDDDLSIVQVDIPESCYRAVCQQLPVITPAHHQSCAKLGCREGVDSEVLECGAPNNLPQHSAISTHSVVPQRSQFLVKKVSKNVNGQESQKLFFVPLEETRIHSRITNPTDFCKTDHSTLQEPGKKWTEMSLGINSSKISVMPAGSRSIERRGRKQVLGYRKGIEASDFTVETCSSSDDEDAGNENQASQSQCRTDITSALLGASASATLCRNSVLAADKVKPSQFSHLVSRDSPRTHVLAARGVSVGNSADQRLLTSEDNILKSESLHSSAHVPSVAAREKAQDNRDPVSCAVPSKGSRDSESNRWARSEASGNVEAVSDMRLSSYNVRGAQLSNGDVHLSIDAVYSAADLSNKQLAASLGLQFSEPLQEETREAPPNFLHSVIPPLFPMYQPQRTESSRFPLKSLQVRPTLVQHPVTPSTQPVPFFHPVLAQLPQVTPQAVPATMANSAKHSLRFHDLPSRPQLLQQQQQNQTKQQTQPFRLISMTTSRQDGQQTRMSTQSDGHVGKNGDAGGSQRDSASCFSAKDWKVVPAPDDDGGADDDVVEVICIDD